MAIFNLRRREIQAKIVYYGPGLSGKTTNLQFIHNKLRDEFRGKLMTLATRQDRTLFFDYLPVELGEVRGLKTRFQLYTVPGQVFYNSTRKLVLKNVDGVVFVADSRSEALSDNLESLKNLEENLIAHRIQLKDMPFVIQYNKRDMDSAMPVEELDKHLNPRNVPTFAAEAHKGTQVLATLGAISKLVLNDLRSKDPNRFDQAQKNDTPAEPASTPSEPVVQETQELTGDATDRDTSEWKLVSVVTNQRIENGELIVPVGLERGSQKITLNLRISLDDVINPESETSH